MRLPEPYAASRLLCKGRCRRSVVYRPSIVDGLSTARPTMMSDKVECAISTAKNAMVSAKANAVPRVAVSPAARNNERDYIQATRDIESWPNGRWVIVVQAPRPETRAQISKPKVVTAAMVSNIWPKPADTPVPSAIPAIIMTAGQ